MTIKIEYWLEVYKQLRKDGDFRLADQLREMLRRMGWEVSNSRDKITAKEI